MVYLRRLSNSYTLLSFLNQTPDVKAATKKLFSHGTIWVDTSVILPLISEQLIEEETFRKFSRIFKACHSTGIEFKITRAIIKEINAHINICISCSRFQANKWQGRIPYLFGKYIESGLSALEFANWTDFFRGPERPDEDLSLFLQEEFDIQPQDLTDEMEQIEDDLRYEAERLWTEAHMKRRIHEDQRDEETIRILVKNDLETYLGVIALRLKEKISELGYRNWLLTFDTLAWNIRNDLRDIFKSKTPPSPLMSFSFLINSMTFGPARNLIEHKDKIIIPFILDEEIMESVPVGLIESANQIRKEPHR